MAPSATQNASAAFRDVYRENVAFVWRVLRRLGVPSADVEDLCQEVFVVVHRKLETFEGNSSLRTWLYTIAHRCASSYRRRAHVRREVATESPELGFLEPPQHRHLEQERARKALDTILGELDQDKRAVFVFYEIEEMTMSEIAEIIDCPLQTAYSRLRAARQHVQGAAKRLARKEF